MPEFVTKEHFDGAIATIREDIRDVIAHFNTSQGAAIMEMLATRKELHNLVRALKRQGIKLEEAEIFTV